MVVAGSLPSGATTSTATAPPRSATPCATWWRPAPVAGRRARCRPSPRSAPRAASSTPSPCTTAWPPGGRAMPLDSTWWSSRSPTPRGTSGTATSSTPGPARRSGARPGPVAVGHLDDRGRLHAQLPKQLHVSPFMGMDQVYGSPAHRPTTACGCGSSRSRRPTTGRPTKVFDADLVLRRQPLTRRSLARRLLRQPLLTYRVWAGIHAHAVALAAKRVPFVRHSTRATDEGPREVDAGAHRKGARTP